MLRYGFDVLPRLKPVGFLGDEAIHTLNVFRHKYIENYIRYCRNEEKQKVLRKKEKALNDALYKL